MRFDLSPWVVRPAIHCNVVIFKFMSEKSLAPSIPALGCFSFKGKEVRGGKERIAGPIRIPASAVSAFVGPGRPQQGGRDSWGAPWTHRKGSQNRFGGILSPRTGESGSVPTQCAALSLLARPSPEWTEPGAPLVSAGPGER